MFNCQSIKVDHVTRRGGQVARLRIKRSGFEPLPGHCVMFLGKTLYSHSAFLQPGVNGYQQTVRET